MHKQQIYREIDFVFAGGHVSIASTAASGSPNSKNSDEQMMWASLLCRNLQQKLIMQLEAQCFLFGLLTATRLTAMQ